jgi:hypothetical protein
LESRVGLAEVDGGGRYMDDLGALFIFRGLYIVIMLISDTSVIQRFLRNMKYISSARNHDLD